eukprot:5209904-Amphidinium_carterae.1
MLPQLARSFRKAPSALEVRCQGLVSMSEVIPYAPQNAPLRVTVRALTLSEILAAHPASTPKRRGRATPSIAQPAVQQIPNTPRGNGGRRTVTMQERTEHAARVDEMRTEHDQHYLMGRERTPRRAPSMPLERAQEMASSSHEGAASRPVEISCKSRVALAPGMDPVEIPRQSALAPGGASSANGFLSTMPDTPTGDTPQRQRGHYQELLGRLRRENPEQRRFDVQQQLSQNHALAQRFQERPPRELIVNVPLNPHPVQFIRHPEALAFHRLVFIEGNHHTGRPLQDSEPLPPSMLETVQVNAYPGPLQGAAETLTVQHVTKQARAACKEKLSKNQVSLLLNGDQGVYKKVSRQLTRPHNVLDILLAAARRYGMLVTTQQQQTNASQSLGKPVQQGKGKGKGKSEDNLSPDGK